VIEVGEWADHYRRWLGVRVSSDNEWRRFARRYPSAPALNAFEPHGGLQTVLTDSTTNGWRKRASQHDEQVRSRRADAARKLSQAGNEAQKLQPRGPKPEVRIAQITEHLKEHGTSSLREIGTALGITAERVRVLVRTLEVAGAVERTESNPNSSKQRYRLVRGRRNWSGASSIAA
jgi:DNA-binding MarR family transcriptional regulator